MEEELREAHRVMDMKQRELEQALATPPPPPQEQQAHQYIVENDHDDENDEVSNEYGKTSLKSCFPHRMSASNRVRHACYTPPIQIKKCMCLSVYKNYGLLNMFQIFFNQTRL